MVYYRLLPHTTFISAQITLVGYIKAVNMPHVKEGTSVSTQSLCIDDRENKYSNVSKMAFRGNKS